MKPAERCPFTLEALVPFCKTKKLARELAHELGDALLESDRARNRGESDDSAFESFFWNGTYFITEDELFDMGVTEETVADFAAKESYDEAIDATFSLCEYGNRRFVVVRYEFKDVCALSAWWLTRKDTGNGA